jgi:hypothetical protein
MLDAGCGTFGTSYLVGVHMYLGKGKVKLVHHLPAFGYQPD